MNHWLNWLATVLAAGAALMTGLIAAWHGLPVLALALRCLVAGVLVFAFVRAGGEFAGKALLGGLAEHELKHEKRDREKRDRTPSRVPSDAHDKLGKKPGPHVRPEEPASRPGDEEISRRQAA